MTKNPTSGLETDTRSVSPANISFEDIPSSGAPEPQGVRDISTAEFMTEVIEASSGTPVLVDFWAPWCGPCKQLGASELRSARWPRPTAQVKLVKMDIDQITPKYAGQMGIQSIPAVVAFVNGRPADAFMGAPNLRAKSANLSPISVGPDPQAGCRSNSLIEAGRRLACRTGTPWPRRANIYAQILCWHRIRTNLRATFAALGQLYLGEQDDIEAGAKWTCFPSCPR